MQEDGLAWVRRALDALAIDVPDHALDQTFHHLGLDSLELLELHQAATTAHHDVTFERFQAELRTPRALARWVENGATQPMDAPVDGPPSELLEAWSERFAASRAHVDDARAHLANNRASAGYRPGWRALTHPIVARSAHGAELVDLDGNQSIDLAMGFGVHLLGHAPPVVHEALRAALEEGLPLGPMDRRAADVARKLCSLTGHDRAAFTNSGTEAVMLALRLARAVTDRDRVVVFQGSYHGTSDAVLATLIDDVPHPLAPGVHAGAVQDTIVLPWNAPAALEWLDAHGSEVAAVLVEPVQSRDPGCQPVAFLQAVREQCTANGSALVFDEIITGFRLGLKGAAGRFNVHPDLATYGKVLGGGLPIGVVAGSSRFLAPVDGGAWRSDDDRVPGALRTIVAGTFTHHPLAMAAASAVLDTLSEPLLRDLDARTERLADRLDHVFARHGVDLHVERCASLFRFVHPGSCDVFYKQLLLEGVHVWEGRTCFLSTAHTNAHLDAIVAAVDRATAKWRPLLPAALPQRAPTSRFGVDLVLHGPLDPVRWADALEHLKERRGDLLDVRHTAIPEGHEVRVTGWRSQIDGWSLGVLLHELAALYGNRPLDPVPTNTPTWFPSVPPVHEAEHVRLLAPDGLARRLEIAGHQRGRSRFDELRARFVDWLPADFDGIAVPVAGQRQHGPLDAVGCHTWLEGPVDADVVLNEDHVPDVPFDDVTVQILRTRSSHVTHRLVLNVLQTSEGWLFEWKAPRDTLDLHQLAISFFNHLESP